MSESALTAAMRPKVYGSSTIGAKKSTVCTSARSSDTRKTPASSNVSRPTSRRGSSRRGRGARARARSPGPILAAQPAQRAKAVRRKIWSRVLLDGIVDRGCRGWRGDLGNPNDGIYFNERASWQAGGLHRGARRSGLANVAGVHLVEGREVGHVMQVDRRLHDVGPTGAGGLEHRAQVREHPLGLRGEAAVDEAAGLRIDTDLAGGEQ